MLRLILKREAFARIAAIAVSQWGNEAPNEISGVRTIDLSGKKESRRCIAPVKMRVFEHRAHKLGFVVKVRCRKCETCMKARRIGWAVRGNREVRAATRSWFITQTLKPELMHQACEAAKADRAKAVEQYDQELSDWTDAWVRWNAAEDALHHHGVVHDVPRPSSKRPVPPATEFEFQARQCHRLLVNALKRIRKGGYFNSDDGQLMEQATATFRYVCVWEKHTGEGVYRGLPHCHILLHEQGTPIAKRWLVKQLAQIGHCKPRLVRDRVKAIWYVVKYLTKADEAKIVASLHYGVTDENQEGDRNNR